MPAKQSGSIATKIAGCAIVTAAIVFGTKSQMPILQQTADQVRQPHFPISLVPVDRGALSQQILHAQCNFDSSISVENASSISTLAEFKTRDQACQEESHSGPSEFEIRLDDQRAWCSQPRRATLASMTTRSAESPEKATVSSSQAPIVPGHEDPHLWFEPQHLQLAIDAAEKQKEQPLPVKPIESVELPTEPTEIAVSVLSQPTTIPTDPFLVKTPSVKKLPISENLIKAVPAPPARVAQAWETGRY